MPLDRLKRIPEKVLMSGGPEKIGILKATIAAVEPTVLITDEVSARTLLEDAVAEPAVAAARG